MTRPSSALRRAGAWAVCGLGLVGGCAGPASPPLAAGARVAPRAACSADAASPQVIDTNPAVFEEAVFERGQGWESHVAFRIDERGVPDAVAIDPSPGMDEAVAADVRRAIAGYRFCPPVAFSPATRWSATVRFRPVFGSRDARDTRMFVQMFIPSYTREDVHWGRTGTTRVKAVFDDAGRPQEMELVASSGDAVLDQKSLQAMASWQLVFRPGVEPHRPITFEQPYHYVIR